VVVITMRLSHTDLVNLVQKFGYMIPDDGVCRGFSGMLSQASFCSEKEKFYARLDLLARYSKTPYALVDKIAQVNRKAKQESLTDEETELLEIPAFFAGINLYMYPSTYKEISNLRVFGQMNLSEIFELTRPKSLENIGLSVYLRKIYAADKNLL